MNVSSAAGMLMRGLMLALVLTLPACANKTPGKPLQTTPDASAQAMPAASNPDPLETVNRGIFRFNEIVDGVLLNPLAHIYRGVVPQVAQTGVHNALNNLNAPVVFINSVLQADMQNAARTFGRFVVNSTLGIAGIFDVATPLGMKKEHKKDFGQTLGVWGVGNGPYVMLPIIGPSTLRDTAGLGVDVADDPWTWIFTWQESVIRDGVRVLVTRTDYIPLTDRIYRDSLDPYATFRSIYLQHRAKVVRDYLRRDSNGMEQEKTGK